MMSDSEWQRKLFHTKKGEQVCDVLDDKEFLKICNGKAYRNWDDNYYCIIEALIAEAIL
jgi:hypothetical protein